MVDADANGARPGGEYKSVYTPPSNPSRGLTPGWKRESAPWEGISVSAFQNDLIALNSFAYFI